MSTETRRVRCCIDGCRNAATLILHSIPDDETFCDDHRHLYEPDEWLPTPEPCTASKGACVVCDFRAPEAAARPLNPTSEGHP